MAALSPPLETQNLIAAKLTEQLAGSEAHAQSQQLMQEAHMVKKRRDQQEMPHILSSMLASVNAANTKRSLEQICQDAKPGFSLRTPPEQALSHWCRAHITSLQSAECVAREQHQQQQEQTDLWAPNFKLALDVARRHFATKHLYTNEPLDTGDHCENELHQPYTEQNESPVLQPPLGQQGTCSHTYHHLHQQQQETEQGPSPAPQTPLDQQELHSRANHQHRQQQQRTEQGQSPASQTPQDRQELHSRADHHHPLQRHTRQNKSPALQLPLDQHGNPQSQSPVQHAGILLLPAQDEAQYVDRDHIKHDLSMDVSPQPASLDEMHVGRDHVRHDRSSSSSETQFVDRDHIGHDLSMDAPQPALEETRQCVDRDHIRHDSSSSSSSSSSARKGVLAGSPVKLPQKAVLCQALQSAKLRAMAEAMLSMQGPVHAGEPEECEQVPIPATLLALATLPLPDPSTQLLQQQQHSRPLDPSTQLQQQQLCLTQHQQRTNEQQQHAQEPMEGREEGQQGKQPLESKKEEGSPHHGCNPCVKAHMKIEKINMQSMADASHLLRQQAAALGIA